MSAPVTRAEKRACALRELKLRRRAYPRWVAQGRMTEAEAAREIEVMEAIAADYCGPVEPDLFGAAEERG